MTFLKWQMVVSIEGTVSTIMRSLWWNGSHTFRLVGSPALVRTTFANRVDQLDPIAIDHAQQPGFCQKEVGPVLMGGKQAKQPSALGQLGEQVLEIAHQPVIEGTVAHTLLKTIFRRYDSLYKREFNS